MSAALYTAAPAGQTLAAPRAAATTAPGAGLARVHADAGDATVATIQGNALDSLNRPLPDSLVRLRDARLGAIVAVQTTDKTGLFSFGAVDPGIYVVELVDENRSVLDASDLLIVNAGDTALTFVQLPLRIEPNAGLFGHVLRQAAAVSAAAAASGVLAQSVTGVDASAR